MSNLELLFDHYKDMCKKQEALIKKRNHMFSFFCLIVTILFLLTSQENNMYLLIISYFKNSFNLDLFFPIHTLITIVWLLMFYIMLQYYSTIINLERGYQYIHNLEDRINEYADNKLITREKEFYLNKYPFILNFSDIFHKKVIPIIFLLLIIGGYIVSVIKSDLLSFSNIIGIIVVGTCSVLTVSFLLSKF